VVDAYNKRGCPDAPDQVERPFDAIQHILVHTGQHYDDAMSGSFFRDLHLPEPAIHLGVGSGSHAVQTAEVMKKFEEVLLREKPDVVVVLGDVNSTLACALVAAKVPSTSVSRPLIAHVEAGLRSFDRSMPEEVNRVLTDHVSDLLFVTEHSGLQNLRREGIAPEKIHFVGNTMIDSLLTFRDRAEESTVLSRLGFWTETNGVRPSITPYALLTLHRPTNVDDRATFLNILAGLAQLAEDYPVVFPAHPRTQQRIREFGLGGSFGANGAGDEAAASRRHGFIMTDPLGYLDFLCLMRHAALVVTDSGGIQEETTCLGIPCVTVRENTERPVTVENGTNTIAGTSKEGIRDAIRRQMVRQPAESMPPKWDGQAARRIVDILIRAHEERTLSRPSPR
jgi:UDP-N-acetylglucosamine 2-epimerase (non-hydrolysing)